MIELDETMNMGQVRVWRGQNRLNAALIEYRHIRQIGRLEWLRALTLEMREILLDMEPKIERAEKFSALKDLIKEYQQGYNLSDTSVLQALSNHVDLVLSYMGGLEKKNA